MKLYADGNVGADVTIYSLSGIFGEVSPSEKLIQSSNKFDMSVGDKVALAVSNYAPSFDENAVSYEVVEGGEFVSLESGSGIAFVTAKDKRKLRRSDALYRRLRICGRIRRGY